MQACTVDVGGLVADVGIAGFGSILVVVGGLGIAGGPIVARGLVGLCGFMVVVGGPVVVVAGGIVGLGGFMVGIVGLGRFLVVIGGLVVARASHDHSHWAPYVLTTGP